MDKFKMLITYNRDMIFQYSCEVYMPVVPRVGEEIMVEEDVGLVKSIEYNFFDGDLIIQVHTEIQDYIFGNYRTRG